MPKKFAGENSKAVAAKARKAEKAEVEKNKKEKEIEDAKWADDDKSAKKKQARKEDAERKKQEALVKKQERDRLLAEEDAKEKGGSKKLASVPTKVTRAQIRENAEQREKAAKSQAAAKEKEVITHLDTPLEENLNRVDLGSETATNLDDAIAVLRLSDSPASVDKHPEKRMKACYEEFESVRLPQLKTENPNLRLSQLKQMLRKEWQKHPDNPLNRKLAAMNS